MCFKGRWYLVCRRKNFIHMRKNFSPLVSLSVIFVICCSAVCASAVVTDAVQDGVTPVGASAVRLSGPVAAKMNALVHERFMSETARTVIYDEAENAFRTHYDDLHTEGMGWWQGEYWGKTMLSAAEV